MAELFQFGLLLFLSLIKLFLSNPILKVIRQFSILLLFLFLANPIAFQLLACLAPEKETI